MQLRGIDSRFGLFFYRKSEEQGLQMCYDIIEILW
jgi:hypothetical protein